MGNKVALGLEILVLALAAVISVLAIRNYLAADELWHSHMDVIELEKWRYDRKQ